MYEFGISFMYMYTYTKVCDDDVLLPDFDYSGQFQSKSATF